MGGILLLFAVLRLIYFEVLQSILINVVRHQIEHWNGKISWLDLLHSPRPRSHLHENETNKSRPESIHLLFWYGKFFESMFVHRLFTSALGGLAFRGECKRAALEKANEVKLSNKWQNELWMNSDCAAFRHIRSNKAIYWFAIRFAFRTRVVSMKTIRLNKFQHNSALKNRQWHSDRRPYTNCRCNIEFRGHNVLNRLWQSVSSWLEFEICIIHARLTDRRAKNIITMHKMNTSWIHYIYL